MNRSEAIVAFVQVASYAPAEIRDAMERLYAPLGGMGAFVKCGQSVVLKPNFLRPAAVESALSTHPEIIRAAAAAAKQNGAREVIVTDSPGFSTARRCAQKLGLETDGPSFQVVDANDPTTCDTAENLFRKIRVSKRMRDAEVLINLAKVKSHAQMGMTLAVKNTFGAVIGSDKAQWHYRAGKDPLRFADLIVRIHERIQPTLNILDGIWGMEGNGPGSGDPRHLGFLMASDNAHALDWMLCKILGVDPQSVCTLKAASQLGLCPDEARIQMVGDPIAAFKLKSPWTLARPVSTKMLGAKWLSPVVEHLLRVSPFIDRRKCTLCLRCIASCAAHAMSRKDNAALGYIDIDKKKCISCFCCQEMCPEGAITVKAGRLGRILGLGIR